MLLHCLKMCLLLDENVVIKTSSFFWKNIAEYSRLNARHDFEPNDNLQNDNSTKFCNFKTHKALLPQVCKGTRTQGT